MLPAYYAHVLQFAQQLRSTADFHQAGSRAALAGRVLDLWTSLQPQAPQVERWQAYLEAAQGQSADGLALCLNHLEEHTYVRQALSSAQPALSLRALGQQLCGLQALQAHATIWEYRLLHIEPARIQLCFAIAAAQRLGLPGGTRHMVAPVPEIDASALDAGLRQARRAMQAKAQVEAFLHHWHPWQQHLQAAPQTAPPSCQYSPLATMDGTNV